MLYRLYTKKTFCISGIQFYVDCLKVDNRNIGVKKSQSLLGSSDSDPVKPHTLYVNVFVSNYSPLFRPVIVTMSSVPLTAGPVLLMMRPV